MKRFRLLGYYSNPGQNMNPESEQVQKANELAPLLEASINSILLNPDACVFRSIATQGFQS